jgi:hypothetical protein
MTIAQGSSWAFQYQRAGRKADALALGRPLELYPTFGFRRREFVHHPWWGDLVGDHPKVAEDLRRRIREEGPLRSAEMEGSSGKGWWNHKLTKKVATERKGVRSLLLACQAEGALSSIPSFHF